MVLQRCVLFTLLVSAFSCKEVNERVEPLPEMAQLHIIDSTEVSEENQFFSIPSEVKLIGDSLIAVSSYLTPGVWFIDTGSGKIKHRIVDEEIMEISIFPAAIDVSKFPIVYILHPKLNKIDKFNVVTGEFLGRIELIFPEDKIIRTIESLFLAGEDQFLIELYPSNPNNSIPEFYKSDSGIIGKFNLNGELVSSFLQYPEELSNLDEPLMAYKSFVIDNTRSEPIIAFPASGEVLTLDEKNTNTSSIYNLPKSSRYFDFNLQTLPRPINPQVDKNLIQFPTSHFFESIAKNGSNLYLQSEMRDNSQLETYKASSHLFWINLEIEKVYETTYFDPSELGILAGASMDTLYFFEGSLKKSEKKYIKRGVLKTLD